MKKSINFKKTTSVSAGFLALNVMRNAPSVKIVCMAGLKIISSITGLTPKVGLT
jgi:hypothetical protein